MKNYTDHMQAVDQLLKWVNNYALSQNTEQDIHARAVQLIEQLREVRCRENLFQYMNDDQKSTVFLRDELLHKFTDYQRHPDFNSFAMIDSAHMYKLNDGETLATREKEYEEAEAKAAKELATNEPYKYDDTAKKVFCNEFSAIIERYKAFYAFGDDQFNAKKQKNVTYVDMGGGLYCPEDNAKQLNNDFCVINDKKKADHLKNNGKRNIIIYELHNHEAFYTGETEDTFEAVEDYGITLIEVNAVFKQVKQTVNVW